MGKNKIMVHGSENMKIKLLKWVNGKIKGFSKKVFLNDKRQIRIIFRKK